LGDISDAKIFRAFVVIRNAIWSYLANLVKFKSDLEEEGSLVQDRHFPKLYERKVELCLMDRAVGVDVDASEVGFDLI
jgi:hypothetical protein